MKFGIYPKLTKDYILKRLSQEEIMEKYWGVSLVFGEQVCSQLRIDNNPTCGFYYNQYGRLRLRDMSGHFWGDCFDMCAYRLNVDSSNKRAFQLVLHTIAKDFKIHKYEDDSEIVKYEKLMHDFTVKRKPKITTQFKILPRLYNSYDKLYWDAINVNKALLEYGRVYFAQEISISKDNLPYTNIYRYKTKDPAYCYYRGKNEQGIDLWKIYFPVRKKNGEIGFFSNSSVLQGKSLITCGRIGGFTKSYKDVLAFRSLGIQTVAPDAESNIISFEDYWFMRTKFDYLFSCMDYDRAGMIMAKQLRDKYRIQPIMFTNGNFGSKDFGSKDFSDYLEVNKKDKTLDLIKSIIAPYQHDFNDLDTYYYNSLKHIKP